MHDTVAGVVQVGVGLQTGAGVYWPFEQLCVPHVVPSAKEPSPGQFGSAPVQRSTASHEVVAFRHTTELGSSTSGHPFVMPSQRSTRSHNPVLARHWLVEPRFASVGQVAVLPVQRSSRSQGPAEARQTTELVLSTSAGQAALTPSHRSSGSHEPIDPRQTVDALARTSDGQTVEAPVQSSAGSHRPDEPRHVVVLGASTSPGQVADEPVQNSGRSHTVAAGRQLKLADWNEHVPTDPLRLHASHAPPQAVLQQTPSMQLPETHCVLEVHAWPFVCCAWQVPALQYCIEGHDAESAGQVAVEPVQLSAGSQPPEEARQTVLAALKPSAGQAADEPVQFSP